MTLEEYKKNPYAWPGGYQLLALMGDGETLCHKCICEEKEVYDVASSFQHRPCGGPSVELHRRLHPLGRSTAVLCSL